MFNDFRKFVKRHNLRGWRLLSHDNQLYLQKYCDKYNLEEYRFFLKVLDGEFNLTHGVRFKSDDTSNPVAKKNTYFKSAKNICDLMNTELSQKNKVS